MRAGYALLVAGLCWIAAPPADAETHTINQVSTVWEPSELMIVVGDTVEWVWDSLAHTVTNGTGPADPGAGSMFDAPLDALNPTVSFTFETAGDVPFFCRPHFSVGMTGVIHVLPATPVEDATWSDVKNRYR